MIELFVPLGEHDCAHVKSAWTIPRLLQTSDSVRVVQAVLAKSPGSTLEDEKCKKDHLKRNGLHVIMKTRCNSPEERRFVDCFREKAL